MPPQEFRLFPQSREMTIIGASAPASDGKNPLRHIEHQATLGWPGPAGLFFLDANFYVRACGGMRLRFGDEVRTVADNGKGNGYQHFLFKTQVEHPERGLEIEALCTPNASAPLVMYQANITRITPPPAPRGQIMGAVVLLICLLVGLAWILGLLRLSRPSLR